MTEKELCLEGRIFTNIWKKEGARALQGECTAQRRLSEAEVEMDGKSWERRNSDIALYESNQQLESHKDLEELNRKTVDSFKN